MIALGAGVGLLATALAGYQFKLRPAWDAAQTGANYVAQNLCTCLFVLERRTDACQARLHADYRDTAVTIEHQRKQVQARMAGIIVGESRYEPQFGCTLQ